MLKRLSGRLDTAFTGAEERWRAGALAVSQLALAAGALLVIPTLVAAHVPLTLPRVAAVAAALATLSASASLMSRGRLAGAARVLAFGLWLVVNGAALLSPGPLWMVTGIALLSTLALSVSALPRGQGYVLTGLYAASVIAVSAVHYSGRVTLLTAPRWQVLRDGSVLLLAVLVVGAAAAAVSAQAIHTLTRAAGRRRKLEQLLHLSRQVSAALQLDEMLDAVADGVRVTFGCSQVQILLVDRDREFAELRAVSGEYELQLRAGMHHLRLSQDTTAGRVVASREPLLNRGRRRHGTSGPGAGQAELAVPLKHGDDVLGVLTLRCADPDMFTDETIDTLQPFADHLGASIQHLRTLNSRAALLQATSPILRADQQIAAASHPQEIIDALRANITQSADTLVLLSAGRRSLIVAAAWDSEGTPPSIEYPLRLLDVLQGAGGTVVLEPAQFDVGLREAIAGPLGAESLLLSALHARGRTVGCLVVAGRVPAAFSEDDVESLESLRGQVAAALDNLQQIARLEASLTETTALYDAMRSLHGAQAPEAVYERVLRVVAGAAGADRALFFVAGPDPHEDAQYVERVAVWQGGRVVSGRVGARYPNHPSPAEWQLPLSREERVFNGLALDERLPQQLRDEYQRRGVNALAVMPLQAGQTWLGAIVVEAQQGQSFSERQMSLVAGVVAAAAQSIDLNLSLTRLQRTADRERTAADIVSRLQRAPSVSLLLKGAAHELAQVLGTDGVYAEIKLSDVETGPAGRSAAGVNGHRAAAPAEEARAER